MTNFETTAANWRKSSSYETLIQRYTFSDSEQDRMSETEQPWISLILRTVIQLESYDKNIITQLLSHCKAAQESFFLLEFYVKPVANSQAR